MDEKSSKMVEEWRQRLVLRDFWSTVNKKLRSVDLVNDIVVAVVQNCLDDFELYEDKDKKIVAEMASVFKWMYGPTRKITDFMRPG